MEEELENPGKIKAETPNQIDGRTDWQACDSQTAVGASLQGIRPDKGLMREHYKRGWGAGGTTQLLLLPTINRPSHNAMGHAPVASHRVEEDVFQGMAHILMVLKEEKKSVFLFFNSSK